MADTFSKHNTDIQDWVKGYRINQWDAERILRAFDGDSDAARIYLETKGGWGALWDEVKRREETS